MEPKGYTESFDTLNDLDVPVQENRQPLVEQPEIKTEPFGTPDILKPEPPEATFLEEYSAMYDQITVTGALSNMASVDRTFDPDYKIENDEQLKEDLKDLDPETKAFVIENSFSREAALNNIEQAKSLKQSNDILMEMGLGETLGYGLLAAGTDPFSYIAGIGEAKAFASILRIQAMKNSAFAKVGAGVGTGAAVGFAYELPQYSSNPYTDETDMAIAAATGGILGGGLSLFTNAEKKQIAQDTVDKSIVSGMTDDQLSQAIESEKAFLKEAQKKDSTVRGSIRENALDDLDVKDSEVRLKKLTEEANARKQTVEPDDNKYDRLNLQPAEEAMSRLDDSIGAARTAESESQQLLTTEVKETEDQNFQVYNELTEDAKANELKTPISNKAKALSDAMPAKTTFEELSKYSYSVVADYARRILSIDPFGMRSIPDSAASRSFAYEHDMLSESIYKGWKMNYNNWFSRKYPNASLQSRTGAKEIFQRGEQEFNELLYDHMVRKNTIYERSEQQGDSTIYDNFMAQEKKSVDPAVIKAGEDLDKFFARTLKLAKDKGVKYTDFIEETKGYIHRQWNKNKMMELNNTQRRVYRQLFGKEFARIFDIELPSNARARQTKIESIGDEFISKLLMKDVGLDVNMFDWMAKASDAELSQLTSGMEKSIVDKIMQKRAAISRAKPSEFKRRIDFDMTASLRDKDGIVYSLSDLVSKDMKDLLGQYSRNMSGSIALAEKGIKSRAEFEVFKMHAKTDVLEQSKNKEDVAEVERILDDLYAQLMHKPVEGTYGTGTRMLLQGVASTMYGSSGIPQLVETSTSASYMGIKNMISAIPEFKGLIRDARTGKLNNEALSKIEGDALAVGNEMNYMEPRIENAEVNFEKRLGSKLGRWGSNSLNIVSKTLWYANLMNHIRRVQERVAMFAALKKLDQSLTKWDKLSVKEKARLNSLGYSNDLLEKLKVEHDKGAFKKAAFGNVVDIDLPLDLLSELRMAMRNNIATVIQTARPTEDILFQNKAAGAILTQGLAYPLQATRKQLLRNTAFADTRTAAFFAYTTVAGALVYMLKVEQLTLGMSEAEEREYKRRAYEDGNFIWGTLNYVPYSSMAAQIAQLGGNIGLYGQEYTPAGAYFNAQGIEPRGLESAIANAPALQYLKSGSSALSNALAYARTGDTKMGEEALAEGVSILSFQNWYLSTAAKNIAEQ